MGPGGEFRHGGLVDRGEEYGLWKGKSARWTIGVTSVGRRSSVVKKNLREGGGRAPQSIQWALDLPK